MSVSDGPRVRIRLEGDHTAYHCGSAAAFSALKSLCRPPGDIVGDDQDYDVLVMNGEGSMHHGSKSFHAKMAKLRAAQKDGKRTYLVNSVWQQNPADYDDVLRALDGIHVRGALSQRDLLGRHNVGAQTSPDIAYWAEAEGTPTDFANGTVISDLYAPDLAGFVWPQDGLWPGAPHIDLRQWTWGDLVCSLRTARLFVTGRHHGVYAACKARTPFVAFAGNSHKVEDLLAMAQSPIPVCRTFKQAQRAAIWAQEHPQAYDALYDWLARQPQPRFLE